MGRRIIIRSEPTKNLLNEEEIKIFKSWHPKVNINSIESTWQEGKVKYIKLKNGDTIGIPTFTKEELTIPGRYKGKTSEILSSSLGQKI